jgi:hypothetical protein
VDVWVLHDPPDASTEVPDTNVAPASSRGPRCLVVTREPGAPPRVTFMAGVPTELGPFLAIRVSRETGPVVLDSYRVTLSVTTVLRE